MTTCESHETIQEDSSLILSSAISSSIKTGVKELGAKMTTMEIRQESESKAQELGLEYD